MCVTDCGTAAGRKQQTAHLASSSERQSQNLDSDMLREKLLQAASGKHLILMTALFKNWINLAEILTPAVLYTSESLRGTVREKIQHTHLHYNEQGATAVWIIDHYAQGFLPCVVNFTFC